MIHIRNVSFAATSFGQPVTVLDNASLDIPPGLYALLTPLPAARVPLIDLLSGSFTPKHGSVIRRGMASWPIGRTNFAQRSMTGLGVVRMLARIYSLDEEFCVGFLTEIMSDAEILHEKLESWPGFSRFELCNAAALLPNFDIYVTDGNIDFSRGRFGDFWSGLFKERVRNKTLIVSSYSVSTLFKYCNAALILDGGSLRIESDIERAIEAYPLVRPPTYRSKDAEADTEEEEDV